MKIRLVMLGKTRREEIRALLDDYVRRIGRYAEIEVTRTARRLACRAAQTENRARRARSSCSTPPEDSSPRSNSRAGSAICATAARANSCFSAAMPKAFPPSFALAREAEHFALDAHDAARIRARRPRRANLPRLRDSRRPSLPEVDRANRRHAVGVAPRFRVPELVAVTLDVSSGPATMENCLRGAHRMPEGKGTPDRLHRARARARRPARWAPRFAPWGRACAC